MQFVAFESGVEVNGTTINSVIDGLGSYKTLAWNYLIEAGIGERKDGEYDLDPDGWYSQERWLKVFEKIAEKIGDFPLKQIGMKIPENAVFPPWVKDVDSAVKAIDVAYHMNHRGGEIGHYNFAATGPAAGTVVCNNPYPCDFDRGIITAMAKRFAPSAGKVRVGHDDTKPCRKNGAESCTYNVSW